MLEFDCVKNLGANFSLRAKFEIEKGEFVSLYGKSGSGKTTILRLIAGFEKPDFGEIKLNGKIFYQKGKFLEPQLRNIGYLFQDYALFPNMNIFENLLFAKKDPNFANELLELVGLTELKKAQILNLSGGQKQRVALARALMRRPEVLLLDEPLSALDNEMRERLQDYLLKIHSNFGTTIILVSHDVGEIYKLTKRVFSIENGEIVKDCSPLELFFSNKFQKFSLHAKVLDLAKKDGIFIATILAQNEISKIALSKSEAQNLKKDDKIIISAKAFAIGVSKV